MLFRVIPCDSVAESHLSALRRALATTPRHAVAHTSGFVVVWRLWESRCGGVRGHPCTRHFANLIGDLMIALFKLLRLCLAALLAASFFVSAAYAQKWVKLAPFPEPSEEVYGIASGGKLYVFGGLAPGWKP